MLGPSLTPLPGEAAGSPLVDGWWASTSTGAGDVVPDGAVDVIWTPGRTPFVAGPDREPRPSGLTTGRRVVGVRLRPGVAAAVLDDRVDRATGIAVPLDQVWSSSAVERLAHELGGTDGDARRAQVLADAVIRSTPAGWEPDPTIVRAVEQLRSIDPGRRPADVDTGALGSRQFRRRFSAAMGYGPAFYGRLVRLDRFIDLLAGHPERTLAELAASAGYSDQAHLARDVRQLMDTTPSQLRATV